MPRPRKAADLKASARKATATKAANKAVKKDAEPEAKKRRPRSVISDGVGGQRLCMKASEPMVVRRLRQIMELSLVLFAADFIELDPANPEAVHGFKSQLRVLAHDLALGDGMARLDALVASATPPPPFN